MNRRELLGGLLATVAVGGKFRPIDASRFEDDVTLPRHERLDRYVQFMASHLEKSSYQALEFELDFETLAFRIAAAGVGCGAIVLIPKKQLANDAWGTLRLLVDGLFFAVREGALPPVPEGGRLPLFIYAGHPSETLRQIGVA